MNTCTSLFLPNLNPFMKNLSATLAACVVFSTIHLDAQYLPDSKFFQIDADHSEFRFSVDYMLFGRVSGTFQNMKGVVYYDAAHPAQLSASLKIDASKLTTGNEERDNDLKKSWFEVDKFPIITYETRKAVKNGDTYTITGIISIKGVTKEISFNVTRVQGPVKDIRDDEMAVFEGSTKINRRDFGVNRSNWDKVGENGMTSISDNVTINFTILGKAYNEKNYIIRFANTNTQSGLLYNTIKNADTQKDIESKIDSLMEAKSLTADVSFMTVSNLCLIEKNNPRAKIILEKGESLFPASIPVKERLLEVYYGLRDLPKLKQKLSEILAADPNDPIALEYQKHT